MPLNTSQGTRHLYPYEINWQHRRSDHEYMELFHNYQHAINVVNGMDCTIVSLRSEIQRLTAENAFMYRLINDWENRDGKTKTI